MPYLKLGNNKTLLPWTARYLEKFLRTTLFVIDNSQYLLLVGQGQGESDYWLKDSQCTKHTTEGIQSEYS